MITPYHGGTMAKAHVNARLEASTIEALDEYAVARGVTRTAALEELITKGLQDGEPAPEGVNQREIIDLLRTSNADLREEVSRLWAQVGEKDRQISEKDKQIAAAQELTDQAHHLHAADLTMGKALPEPRGVIGRITQWIHKDRS